MNILDKLRSHKQSIKKAISICLMVFSIVSVYVVVRNVKDGIVIKHMGAEALAFLKLFFVLPFSMLVIMFYNTLHNFFNRLKVPYIIVSMLGFSLATISLMIFSNESMISTTTLSIKPYIFEQEFMKPLNVLLVKIVHCINNWHASFFYMTSEIFGTLCLNAVAWRLANEIFDVNESKIFYGFITISASMAMIFGSSFMMFSAKKFFNNDTSFFVYIGFFVAALTLCAIISYYLTIQSSSAVFERSEKENTQEKNKKSKPGLIQSAKIVFSNDILFCIFLTTIGYMTSINLVEITWKKSVSKQVAKQTVMTVASYCSVSGGVSAATGLITCTGSMFGNFILRIYGWFALSMVSPILAGVLGVAFIFCYAYGSMLGMVASTIMMIGTVHNILAKTCKYALYDLSREISYKYLFNRETRLGLGHDGTTFGKASVEVIGGKLGKQLGSLIQVLLLTITAGADLSVAQERIAQYILGILVVFVVLWIYAVVRLKKYINEEESYSKIN